MEGVDYDDAVDLGDGHYGVWGADDDDRTWRLDVAVKKMKGGKRRGRAEEGPPRTEEQSRQESHSGCSIGWMNTGKMVAEVASCLKLL